MVDFRANLSAPYTLRLCGVYTNRLDCIKIEANSVLSYPETLFMFAPSSASKAPVTYLSASACGDVTAQFLRGVFFAPVAMGNSAEK